MSCREAFARIVSAFIAASTLGCTAVPEPASPYILSDTEITTVQRGLFSALPDLDSPNFRSFKAARTTNGDIYVCGWMSSKNSKGYPSPERAFIGSLSAGRFVSERVGMDEYSTAEIVGKCRDRGITI